VVGRPGTVACVYPAVTGYDATLMATATTDQNGDATTSSPVRAVVYGPGGDDAIRFQADGWSAKAPMPAGRQQFGAAGADGKVYVVGGTGSSPTTQIYDPGTDTWSTGADNLVYDPMMNVWQNKFDLAAASVNGKIYAVGGNSNSTRYATLDLY